MVTRVVGATGTTSVTMPSHQAGDLLVAFAFRDGSTSAATVPAGWIAVNASGANTCWAGLYYKPATSSSEASGTWTNASRLSVVSYRPAAGKALGLGSYASGSAATSSVAYNALTMASAAGASWVAGASGYRTVNTSLETPPTGMTNVAVATGVDATAEIAWHDTDGPVSSWSTQSVSVGGTASGWRSYTFEIAETTVWSPWDKGTGITPSGSNLTASGSSGASIRTTTNSAGLGKVYFEVVTTTTDTVGGQALGFAAAAFTISADSTDSPNAITAWTDGNVYMNDDVTPVGSWASGTWPAGTVISVCVDEANSRFWARKDAGNWNNSGSADPATNTGGYAIINAGPYFGLFTGTHASSSVTLQTATQTIPSGFTDMMAITSSGHSLTATGITVNSPALDTPTLSQLHSLSGAALTVNSPAFSSASVGQNHILSGSNLTVASPDLGTPTLSGTIYSLTANSLTISSPDLGTPTLGLRSNFTADNLTVGGPDLGQPTITFFSYSLTATGVDVGSPVFGTPSIGQNHVVSIGNLVVGVPVYTYPILTDNEAEPGPGGRRAWDELSIRLR